MRISDWISDVCSSDLLLPAKLRAKTITWVASKDPMRGDAPKIQPTFVGDCLESGNERSADAGRPIALEREESSHDMRQRPRLVGPTGMGDRKTGPIQSPDAGHRNRKSVGGGTKG